MTRIEHSVLEGLHLRRSGRVDGRGPVLWIHGLGESGLGLEEMLTRVELADWDHLQIDLPGYGKTPHPPSPVTLEAHAEVLVQALDRITSAPFVVIGHSMGGVIGQSVAEKRPDVVRAFLNVEGNISFDDCTWSRRAMEWDEEQFVRSGFRTLASEILERGMTDLAHASYYPSVRFCHPATFHRNATELVELSTEERLATRLGALDLPVGYLYGDPGGTGPHSRRLLVKAGIDPEAITSAGHWPWIDQPDLFPRRVAAFLASLPSL